MKRKLYVCLLTFVLAISLMACGSKEEKSEGPEEIVYVDEGEIEDVFENPGDYIGKYIKVKGKIFNKPEKKGDSYFYQAWHDMENSDLDFVIYSDKKFEGIKTESRVIVDGKITGEFTGENMMGGEIRCPEIEAVNMEKISYVDAMVPTLSEVVPTGAVADQNGVTVQIDKVEYAETETRVYLTIANTTDYQFNPFVYRSKVVQNGQQLELNTDSMTLFYSPELEELPGEMLPQITASGVMVFPVMDPAVPFQLYLEGMSDNWDLQFEPFTIDVTP